MIKTFVLRIPKLMDPTKLQTLSRTYQSEVTNTYKQLKDRVKKLVHTEDAFGLNVKAVLSPTDIVRILNHMTYNQRWRHQNLTQKIASFNNWLGNEVASGFLGEKGRRLHSHYIQRGFIAGVRRAHNDVVGTQAPTPVQEDGLPMEFSRTSLLSTVHAVTNSHEVHQVQLALADRTNRAMLAVSNHMVHTLVGASNQGLLMGSRHTELAREMRLLLDKAEGRANLTARTELVRAHAQGQLAGMKYLGVKKVMVLPEANKEGAYCKACSKNLGSSIDIDKASGIIPMHPNCRCAWMAL